MSAPQLVLDAFVQRVLLTGALGLALAVAQFCGAAARIRKPPVAFGAVHMLPPSLLDRAEKDVRTADGPEDCKASEMECQRVDSE